MQLALMPAGLVEHHAKALSYRGAIVSMALGVEEIEQRREPWRP